MAALPEPRANAVLMGHEAALAAFSSALASGRVPHAWLITGPSGIGKATLAYHVAHHLLSDGRNAMGKLDLNDPTARLIVAGSHPDLFVLERPVDEKTGTRKATIAVEDARSVAPHLRLTATHGGWRVAIIDGAEALNRFGQNAILKMIEEPPPRSIILMTSTGAGILLPTIRSRCRVLPLEPLSPEVMGSVLQHVGVTLGQLGPDAARILALAGGSVGMALRILESEAMPLYDQILRLLLTAPDLDLPTLHALGDKVAKKDDAELFEVLGALIQEALRQAVRALAGQEKTVEAEGAVLVPLLQNVPALRLLDLWDRVQGLFREAQTASLDRKLTLFNVVLAIRDCAAGKI